MPRPISPISGRYIALLFSALACDLRTLCRRSTFREFAAQAGIELSLSHDSEVDLVKPDNPILNEINIARIKGEDLKTHYNKCGLDIEWHHFEFVERTYRHYKRSKNLLDFTDLLEMIVNEPERLPMLEVLIVDEAQDLSRLQWMMVEALTVRSKRTFLAGDDDQAIFFFAGADVKSFLAFEGSVTILNHSYRVPAKVHILANNIVKRIRERQPKQWESREFEGLVKTYHRFDDVPVESGQWLIMASTNYMLNPIHEWLKSIGVLFERNGVPSLSPQIAQAVVDWERLRRGPANRLYQRPNGLQVPRHQCRGPGLQNIQNRGHQRPVHH
jgi:superfamily I DNA/RNA helicase